ncbi:MAG: protein kinase [Actinobacteria bacterium]|nr:protein kinase [Actinomycetota bacterium]
MSFDQGMRMPAVPLEPLREKDPRQLGEFRLLSRLGAGGMGTAFLAQGEKEWVVVKVVRADVADEPGFAARFQRELAAMDTLNGAGTPRLLASAVEADPPWFAMEFIRGTTLARRVADSGALPVEEVTALAATLIGVISKIHQAGVIHRDLKPANIMLSPDGPRVIDFGIVSLQDSTQVTRTGVVLGSMGWLAPEQVTGDPVTAATDVHAWALCVVFAATGTAPFTADGSAAAIYAVLQATPPIPPQLPQPLRDLLRRALSKDPAERPSVDQALAELSQREPGPAADIASDRTKAINYLYSPNVTPPPSANKSRNKLLMIGAAALVLLVVGIVIGLAATSQDSMPSSSSSTREPAVTQSAAPSASPDPVSTPSVVERTVTATATQTEVIRPDEPTPTQDQPFGGVYSSGSPCKIGFPGVELGTEYGYTNDPQIRTWVFGVQELLDALWRQGLTRTSPGSVDGEYGPQTQAAVMEFQRSRGIPIVGRVGQTTWATLAKECYLEPW